MTKTTTKSMFGLGVVAGCVALTLLIAGGGRGRATAVAARPPRPQVTALAPVRAEAPRADTQPVLKAAAPGERRLPLADVPPADLDFMAEAARLGAPPDVTRRLVALAASGADADALRAAADGIGDMAVKLAARRWIGLRAGEPRPELPMPRPATTLVAPLR